MNTLAVVIDRPEHLSLSHLRLPVMEDEDVVVEVEWSGISTGTERLIWNGHDADAFPGMGYPLVPGYEAVGRIVDGWWPDEPSAVGRASRSLCPARAASATSRALFGGSCFAPGGGRASKVVPVAPKQLGQQAVLLALAATAYHSGGRRRPRARRTHRPT